jgi:hypothetical protein
MFDRPGLRPHLHTAKMEPEVMISALNLLLARIHGFGR